MLEAIVKSKSFSFWIFIHVLLGIGSSFSPVIFAVWFFAFVASSFAFANSGNEILKRVNWLYLISYLASLELLVRMSKGYQYKIPWEFGKYTMLFGFMFGIVVLQARKGVQGFLLFILLIPSFFLSPHTIGDTQEIIANIFGPMAIGLSVAYCYNLSVTKQQLLMISKLVLLPCISVLAYTLVKNPDFTEYTFELGANFKTAGGFGSNQVSTVLGLGTFIVFVFWINNWQLFKSKIYNTILLALFGIQGLLTFSRGGMLGAIVGIIVILFVYFKTDAKQKAKYHVRKISGFVIGAGLAVYLLFAAANAITGGVLELRYAGETNATLRGTREKDLNVLTTNRFDIFMADLELWKEYPVFGTGIGASPGLRDFGGGYEHVAAHVELSRLLAEHGFLGLLYFIVLLLLVKKIFLQKGDPKYIAILLAFYMLAIYTTFHAATRTFITPLLVGLSMVNITDIKEPDADTV